MPGGSPRLDRRRARRDRALRRRAAAACSCSARASRTSTATTSTSCWAASASASATTRVSDYERHHQAPALGPRPTWRAGDGVDLLARVHEACFYRAGVAATRSPDGARVLARAARDRLDARRAAARRRRARRGPRRRAGRLRPVRRRLPRRARPRGAVDEPRRTGPPAHAFAARAGRGPQRPPRADPALARACATAADALRLLQQPDGSRRPRRRTTRPGRRAHVDAMAAARRGPRAALRAPGRLPRRGRSPTCAPGPPAASACPTSRASLERFRPDLQREDGIEHLVRVPDVQAERLARHGLRGADRPRAVAGVAGRARARPLRQREVRAGRRSSTTPPATTRECAVLFPETVSRRRAARSTTSAAIFCDREAERFRARRRRAPPTLLRAQPAARRRRAAGRPSAVAGRLRAVGPRPRPRPQPRRPAVRPVHDPPADAVLDVLAGGAALRPDRVRRGGGAGARGLRVRPPRPVRDPLRPPVPLPGHRAARAQLRRPRRPAAVRLPAPPRATCTGPTTG